MTTHNKKFLVFSLQSEFYALDLADVAEVGDPPQMYPIPLAPPCYCGALNFHGDIVAVMDLALFLGMTGPGKPGKIVVLHHEIASLAFLVETIIKIVSGEEISFGNPPDRCFVAATLDLCNGEALLLDLEALVRDAEIGIRRTRSPQNITVE